MDGKLFVFGGAMGVTLIELKRLKESFSRVFGHTNNLAAYIENFFSTSETEILGFCIEFAVFVGAAAVLSTILYTSAKALFDKVKKINSQKPKPRVSFRPLKDQPHKGRAHLE